MTLSREGVCEALKREHGPWGNAVKVAYLLLLRKCRESLGGYALCRKVSGALTEVYSDRTR